ncbi:hypothetical protein [Sulfoacidibacillus thermotolerans]|uniref:Uncharacterized protein n=1 Tax=Sulfoacidibacillus thermotolerans TaxID=1765684 RepID=A0A2U3CSP6_SULT2|nr:hypothetical protein [Sulfoacidibacillus thermotolerans]PWI52058.1 hypothetical protein BM613_14205 [Sulfoacidibacillus thermotolerans]
MPDQYKFHNTERKLELQAAAYFQKQNLAELTNNEVSQGILNQFAKMVRQEIRNWVIKSQNVPSLQAVDAEIVPCVEEKIALIKNTKSKTIDFFRNHPTESKKALQLLAQRIMSLHKVASGYYFEPTYAVAVIRYELDKELYGIVAPAIKQAVDELRDQLRNVEEQEVIKKMQETIIEAVIQRLTQKVPSLLNKENEIEPLQTLQA